MSGDKFRQRFTQGPTSSLFFERVVQGCHARMGDVVVRDRALAFDVLEGLLQALEDELARPNLPEEDRYAAVLLGASVTLGFSIGLRGEEMAMCQLDLTLEESLASGGHRKRPHVMVVLKGRFKGSRVARERCFAFGPGVGHGGPAESNLAVQTVRGIRDSRREALGTLVSTVAPGGGAYSDCSVGRTAAPVAGGFAGGHARAHWSSTRGCSRVQLPAIHPPRVDHAREESRHGEQCD